METQDTYEFAVSITCLDPSEPPVEIDDVAEALTEHFREDGFVVVVGQKAPE